MKKSTLLLLPFLLLSPVNGSIPLIPIDEIETDRESSPRIVAKTPQSPAPTLELEGDFYSSETAGIVTFLIKGHDKIQASISNETKTRTLQITLNQSAFRSVTEFSSRASQVNKVGQSIGRNTFSIFFPSLRATIFRSPVVLTGTTRSSMGIAWNW